MDITVLLLVVFLSWISIGHALECYVCVNQDSNKDKCVKTTIQCEQEQTFCRSQIRWGIPPYWVPRGDRIYYISKFCDTKEGCENEKRRLTPWCKRDWYNDWECAECCTGDLCNYYVTLGARNMRANLLVTLAVAVGSMIARRLIYQT